MKEFKDLIYYKSSEEQAVEQIFDRHIILACEGDKRLYRSVGLLNVLVLLINEKEFNIKDMREPFGKLYPFIHPIKHKRIREYEKFFINQSYDGEQRKYFLQKLKLIYFYILENDPNLKNVLDWFWKGWTENEKYNNEIIQTFVKKELRKPKPKI